MSTQDEVIPKPEKMKKEKKKEKKKANPLDRESQRKEKVKDVFENLNEDLSGVTEKQEKMKKRKLDELHVDDEDRNITDEERSKRKKERKSESPAATTHNNERPEELKPKKSKKRLSKDKEDASQSAVAGDNAKTSSKKASDEENKKKLKKRRKKDDAISSLPNPAEDATLTDKARSALSYAYTHISSPDSWKFNKAHQNWLAKKFFSLDSVPDKYIPVAVGYLSGCQGGVRQNLIQSCDKRLESSTSHGESPAPSVAPSPSNAPTEQAEISLLDSETARCSREMQETLEARAKTLLKALETPSS